MKKILAIILLALPILVSAASVKEIQKQDLEIIVIEGMRNAIIYVIEDKERNIVCYLQYSAGRLGSGDKATGISCVKINPVSSWN